MQTAGPKSPSEQLHLRIVLETGSEKYYWVNNIVGALSPVSVHGLRLGMLMLLIVAIGVLTNLEKTANSSLLKIDAWNVGFSLLFSWE